MSTPNPPITHFTLPIPLPSASTTTTTTSPTPPQTGTITITEPLPKVYLLTWSAPPDNRMTPAFCKTFHLALDLVQHRLPIGVLVTTSAIGKFYSNGLDYESAVGDRAFWTESLYPLWRRLLAYPMPTIALINGHAFAAGLMTAMMHDYRIQNPSRGYLCLNELDFGAPLRPPMASIFRQKLPSASTFRSMVLESKRFNATEALALGIVDVLGGWEQVPLLVVDRELVKRGKTGVYGQLKEEMWGETLALLDVERKVDDQRDVEGVRRRGREASAQVGRVEVWEGGRGAKL